MPRHPKTTTIQGFKGLNNLHKPENTESDYLKKAVNINIDLNGNISKRKGYTLIDSGNYTSLWSTCDHLQTFGVRDGDLVSIDHLNNVSVIKASVGSSPVYFQEVEDIVYYTSETHSGVIKNNIVRNFGLPLAPTLNLSISSGSLSQGEYQVSFSYLTLDNRESGSKPASVLSVSDNSGISLTVPTSLDVSLVKANIYCSTPNGKILYYITTIALGSTYTIQNVSSSANPMRMFNLDQPPLGTGISYYRGRLFISQKDVLWFSEPFQYEYFNLSSNFVQLPSNIAEVMVVEDGLWVACDDMYYITGSSPESFKLNLKEKVKMVEGTSQIFSGSYIRIDNTPVGYKWLVTTNLGIFVLFNNGLIINLTSSNVSLDKGDTGTSVFLQDEGMNNYLSIIKTNNRKNNSVVGDIVTTSIVRNGIVIT